MSKRSLWDLLDTSSPSNAFQLNSNVSKQRGLIGVEFQCSWLLLNSVLKALAFRLLSFEDPQKIDNVAVFLLSNFLLDGWFQHCIDRFRSGNAPFISILAGIRLYTFSKWPSTWIWFHYRYDVQIYFIWNMGGSHCSLLKKLEWSLNLWSIFQWAVDQQVP